MSEQERPDGSETQADPSTTPPAGEDSTGGSSAADSGSSTAPGSGASGGAGGGDSAGFGAAGQVGGGGSGGGDDKSSTGLDANVAALLANLLGPISGLIFVLIEKESRLVKFHAWQALLFGGVYFVAMILFGIAGATVLPCIGFLIQLGVGVAAFVVWILLMVQAYQGKLWKLPVIGDFAEQQAGR